MAIQSPGTRAAEIRRQVGHPIVDGDGHILEFMPTLQEYIREELGPSLMSRYDQLKREWFGSRTPAERRDHRIGQGPWLPLAPASQTRDLATGYLPQLLAERLDELGLDFTVLYGSAALEFGRIPDQEIRQGICRATNRYWAEFYGAYPDRMTPAAIVPMHTPAEALAELDHVRDLGLKAVMIPSGVMRPIPAIHRQYPELFPRVHWLDTYGLDSEYDYDPVWARCQELGFAVTFHGGQPMATDVMTSRSITNYMYNHIGSPAFLMHQVCKSIFMGGVTRRFPNLTFGFLECGVAWACQLLADIEEHWEKRNTEAMAKRDMERLDREAFRRLHEDFGGVLTEGKLDEQWLRRITHTPAPEDRDEWRHTGIRDEHEIADLFVRTFYFGCEADDRTAAFAFSPANAFGATLQAMLSSDIGHWDVMDMQEVIPDSYSLVEKGIFTPEMFRKFTFEHPVALHQRMNPRFFEGTRFAAEAARVTAHPA
ncbi:MAG TPA: amidohydrolase family protein [Dehalococcoidia bacterium]|nr:amidohydrolase family protein [Dehalococcoidia bacterium]